MSLLGAGGHQGEAGGHLSTQEEGWEELEVWMEEVQGSGLNISEAPVSGGLGERREQVGAGLMALGEGEVALAAVGGMVGGRGERGWEEVRWPPWEGEREQTALEEGQKEVVELLGGWEGVEQILLGEEGEELTAGTAATATASASVPVCPCSS